MDHRYNSRRPIFLDAVIESRALGRIPCRVKNIGLGGVFLEIPRVKPALNSVVELSLSVPLNGTSCRCQMFGIVVHQTERGVGLMFEELSPADKAAVKSLAESAPGRFTHKLPIYAGRTANPG